jgi:hypothetical protein
MTAALRMRIVAALVVLAAAPSARAEESAAVQAELPAAGAWGVGAVQTPSALRGLEVEYYLDRVLISAVVGVLQYSPAEGESLLAVGGAAGGFYRLIGRDRVELMAGGRVAFGYASVADTSVTQLNIEAPARLQWHVARRLAVHFETGLVVAFIPEDGQVLGAAPGFGRDHGVAIGVGQASLLGSAGMTLYF